MPISYCFPGRSLHTGDSCCLRVWLLISLQLGTDWRPKELVGTFPAFSSSSGNNIKLPAFSWKEFVHASSTPTSATATQVTSPSNHLVLITVRAQHSWFTQNNIKLKKNFFQTALNHFPQKSIPQVRCRGSRQICTPSSFSWKELEWMLSQLLPVIPD